MIAEVQAISPGLEKLVPNLEFVPGDRKKEASTDLEIAAARNLRLIILTQRIYRFIWM